MESPHNLHILIIEDSKMVSKVLTDGFIRLCHSCDKAETLAEARNKLTENHYDLVTMDIHLPDGEATDLLKEFDIFKNNITQVAIYTADEYALTPELLANYNILDYFVKDGTISKTVNDINRLYKNRLKNAETKILIVDDSSTIRLTLEIILQSRNYQVLQASSAKEGLDMLIEHHPDMVILDLILPDMHGSKVLEKIKSSPKFHNLPVLILSGSESSETMRKVYKLGASDFVKKPFVYEELLLKVDFWVDYIPKTSRAIV